MLDFKGKKVTVVGLGESGLATAKLLIRAGAKVRVTDNREDVCLKEKAGELADQGVEVELGRHTDGFVDGSELVVVSPGVPLDIPLMMRARQNNIKIISEIELGYLFSHSPIIAVTGTNGKSTVVTLLNQIFSQAGLKVLTCGNIGPAFCSVVAEATADTTVIMEVSSFQLDLIDRFQPRVSVILNFSPDHLTHHGSFEKYIQAKLRIFENQQEGDFLIINDKCLNQLRAPGEIKPKVLVFSAGARPRPSSETADIGLNIYGQAFLEGEKLIARNGDVSRKIINVQQIKLKGAHNLENALAAVLAALASGVKMEDIAQTLSEFRSLPHRIEHFLTHNKVSFIDDSKATNVEATLCALEAVQSPIILIAGGKDKGLDYGLAGKLIGEKVKLIILIGEAKEAIKAALANRIPAIEALTMKEAVGLAWGHASRGDNILLSPMCSSLDMFDNFEHRGRVFKKAVEQCIKQGEI